MPPLFVFGTLMDPEILARVLGRDADPETIRAGWVRGVRRVFVAGRSYPMLVPHPGGRVGGHLLLDLGDEDRRRLNFYEGWEYRLAPVSVTTESGHVAAEMFVGRQGVAADRRDWRLDQWQRIHKPVFLARLGRLMDSFPTRGRRPPFTPGA